MCPYQYNLMYIQCKCLYILSPLFTQWQILYKRSLLSPPLLSVPFGSGSLSVIKVASFCPSAAMVVHSAAPPLFNQVMGTEVLCRLLLHTDAVSRLVRLSFHHECPLHVDRCPWMSHKLWQLTLSPQCLSLKLPPPVSPNPWELASLRARKWSLAWFCWSGAGSLPVHFIVASKCVGGGCHRVVW